MPHATAPPIIVDNIPDRISALNGSPNRLPSIPKTILVPRSDFFTIGA